MDNPFKSTVYDGMQMYYVSADDRITQVKHFDHDQCIAALQVRNLQTRVEKAIRSRLRQLELRAKMADTDDRRCVPMATLMEGA